MNNPTNNPNVGTVEITRTGTITRSESGEVSFLPKGGKDTDRIVLFPSFTFTKSKIVPPTDISGRSWETVLHLGKSPDSRIYTMKIPGSDPYTDNRGRVLVVDSGVKGEKSRTFTIWIGTVETLRDRGYVDYHPTDSLDVWTLTTKGRKSVLPQIVTDSPKVETK